MNYTTNYNLNKPEPAEQYNIAHWNENSDTLDRVIKENFDTNNENIANAIADEVTNRNNAINTATQNLEAQIQNIQSGSNPNSLLSKFSMASINPALATTENIPSLSNVVTIDGVTTVEGMIVLVKNQTNEKYNGLWVVHESSAWERHEDFIATNSMCNKFFMIQNGDINKNKMFYLENPQYMLDGLEANVALNFKQSIIQQNPFPNSVPMRDSNGILKGAMPTSLGSLILNAQAGESGEINITESGFYYIEMEGGKGGNGGDGYIYNSKKCNGGIGKSGQLISVIQFLLSGTYNYIVGGNGGNGGSISGDSESQSSGGSAGFGYDKYLEDCQLTYKGGRVVSSGGTSDIYGGNGGINGKNGENGSVGDIGTYNEHKGHGGGGGGGGGNTAFYNHDKGFIIVACGGGGGSGGSVGESGSSTKSSNGLSPSPIYPNTKDVDGFIKLWKLI